MEKRPVGRPKKINAVKSGELKKSERRFTFITTGEIIDKIRRGSNEEELTIREYLNEILHHYWEWEKSLSKREKFIYRSQRERKSKK